MQQLLTGQLRLSGFNGEWQSLNIDQHSLLNARIGWQGLTTAEYLSTGTHHLVTGTDFSGGRVNWSTCPFVSAERYDQDRNIQLRTNDVLLTKDGTIGKVTFVDVLPEPATLKVHRLKAMGSGDTNTLSRLKPTFAAAQTAAFRRRSFGGSDPFGTS